MPATHYLSTEDTEKIFSQIKKEMEERVHFFQKNGRYGRSLGCPVLPTDIYKQVIETIKEGTMVFAYYTNKRYLASSKYLKVSDLTKNNTF